MAKRYVRRKKSYKRRSYKKRIYKRMPRNGKVTRYDGTVYSKCIQTDNFQVNGGDPYAVLVVSWGSNGASD